MVPLPDNMASPRLTVQPRFSGQAKEAFSTVEALKAPTHPLFQGLKSPSDNTRHELPPLLQERLVWHLVPVLRQGVMFVHP